MALAFLENLQDKLKIVGVIVVAILILKVAKAWLGRGDEEEGFINIADFFRMIIQRSQQQSQIGLSQWQTNVFQNAIIQDSINSYNKLIGFIYRYPEESGTIRLDIKNRFFENSPRCIIRRDWATSVPPGLNIPIAAGNKTEAAGAYTAWVKCLQDKTPQCQSLLEDYRRRFLIDECPQANLNYNPDAIQLRYPPDWFPTLR